MTEKLFKALKNSCLGFRAKLCSRCLLCALCVSSAFFALLFTWQAFTSPLFGTQRSQRRRKGR